MMKHCFAAMVFTGALLGCATPPPPAQVPLALFDDPAFAPPAELPGSVDVFAVSPAMQRFLQSPEVAHDLRTKGVQRGLFEALRDKSGLRIQYDAAMTRTAAQTWETGAGNCLSLVILTAALANALNMPVVFQEVNIEPSWGRLAGLYFAAGHVNIRLGRRLADRDVRFDTSSEFVIDFLPPADLQHQPVRAISRNTVVAMYMNNRAVEALADGLPDQAYWWAREALVQAPAFTPAYNTLGVVYQRKGDWPHAQGVLEAALQHEPTQVMALSNLAQVMQAQGNTVRAGQLLTRLQQLEPQAPYAYFDQGVAAMGRQDYAGARALFAREISRDPYNAEFHFWLALANYRLGDVPNATRHMDLATQVATTLRQRDLYTAKLEKLKALGSATGQTPMVQ